MHWKFLIINAIIKFLEENKAISIDLEDSGDTGRDMAFLSFSSGIKQVENKNDKLINILCKNGIAVTIKFKNPIR